MSDGPFSQPTGNAGVPPASSGNAGVSPASSGNAGVSPASSGNAGVSPASSVAYIAFSVFLFAVLVLPIVYLFFKTDGMFQNDQILALDSSSVSIAIPMERQSEREIASPSKFDESETSIWPFFRATPGGEGVFQSVIPDKPTIKWTYSCGKDAALDAPMIVANGYVFAADSNGNVTALNLQDGKVIWQIATKGMFQGSPLWDENVLYLGDLDGKVLALDASTGKTIWEQTAFKSIKGGVNSFEQLLLVGDQSGTVTALAKKDGQVVWTYQSEDQIQSCPIVSDGCCFVAGCDARLHVIDAKTGQAIQQVDLEAPTGTNPVVSGKMAWIGTEGNEMLAIDLTQKKIQWRFATDQSIRTPAAFFNNTLYFGTQGRELLALDATTGEKKWSIRSRSRFDAGILCSPNRVLAVSYYGLLYVIESDTGNVLSQTELDGAVLGTPAIVEGKIIVGTDQGTVYCLGNP